MKKLWEKKSGSTLESIEKFTVGLDREFDLYLAPFDVLGSIAHVKMLAKVGLLKNEEAKVLVDGLQAIAKEIDEGSFKLEPHVEDIHSQIELLLTARLGEVGKKIHMARSRNDQVLVDLKLFLRDEVLALTSSIENLFNLLLKQSEQFKNDLLPGYTHLQLAMPSSFGLWFGAYAESLVDDLTVLKAAFDVVNKNPLGSAAGFGSSFPIDRTLTTKLLGFADLNYNVVYAQMGRGKTERVVAMGLANLADTLSSMSMDVCLFMNQNFGFVSFPDELTTGSSIMPHKKNPDVFELIRSRMNRMKALPNEILMMTTNLPSGYHRDLQILKEHLFPAFQEMKECLAMAEFMLSEIRVEKNLLADPKYRYLFSVEAVNKLVGEGVPFRDAYQQVGASIEAGTFAAPTGRLAHTHEGSIGNLCTSEINRAFQAVQSTFPREAVKHAMDALLAR
jgi:argininosuccinate lyase